jgi:hypothetical protein
MHAPTLINNDWHIANDCISFRTKVGKATIIPRVHGQNIRLSFKLNSRERGMLRRSGRKLVGQRLGILRTDSETQPLVLRIIPREESKV